MAAYLVLCVLDEELFRDSELRGGRYCSPLLLNAIFALGARFSDRKELRLDPADPGSAGKIFLERAEALLPSDLKWPSITTIQSLCILSTVAIAHGSDATGWLYQGMAKTLALDMGLNIDPGDLAISHSLTSKEVNLRRLVYWSLYFDDKLSALYTGRVCTMLGSQANVELPDLQTGSESSDARGIEESMDKTRSSPQSYVPYMKAFVTLSRILETILTTLYTPQSFSTQKLESSFLESCLLDLKNWSYDLPTEAKMDRTRGTSRSPHIFILHMVYHTTYIIVAKFFSTPRNAQIRPDEEDLIVGQETKSTVHDHANKICYDAAREVCAVAIRYRQTFGSFRQSPITATHCILSAALILLRKLAVDGKKGSSRLSDQTSLDLCLEVLYELSTSWQPARSLRLHILNILENSQAQSEFTGQRAKANLGSEEAPPTSVVYLHEDHRRHYATHGLPNSTLETEDTLSTFDAFLLGSDCNQTAIDFDFDNFSSHDNDFEGLLHNSTLPMDYLNFDTTNNWFLDHNEKMI